jgi:ketosteroid isomerase-like protein
MSANLDLVRSIYADWERGDFSSAEWADPNIEFEMADGPQPIASTGLAGMANAFRDWLSPWEHFSSEADEYRAVDDERVLVLIRRSGTGKSSQLKVVVASGAVLFHLRDGTVTRLVLYNDRDRAVADLGLDESGD